MQRYGRDELMVVYNVKLETYLKINKNISYLLWKGLAKTADLFNIYIL